jgi:hypothetical protein
MSYTAIYTNLLGTADFVVSGLFDWRAGTVGGTGTLTSLGQMHLGLDSYEPRHIIGGGRAVVNAGTAAWDGGDLEVGGSFVNRPGASFTASGGATAMSSGLFDNQGAFVDAAPGTLTAGSTFDNEGTVQVLSGTLALNGGYTQTSGATVLAGGSISSSTPLNIQGGVLKGTGTIFGSVINAGQVSPGDVGTPGALTITGSYTQTPAGVLNVDLGGLAAGSQYDQLAVAGPIALAGALNTTLLNGFVPVLGNSFAVVNNTGSTAISGTFNGLSEGAPLTVGANPFRITYLGVFSYLGVSDNNSVVLTALNAPPANVTPTLTTSTINEGQSATLGGRSCPL